MDGGLLSLGLVLGLESALFAIPSPSKDASILHRSFDLREGRGECRKGDLARRGYEWSEAKAPSLAGEKASLSASSSAPDQLNDTTNSGLAAQ